MTWPPGWVPDSNDPAPINEMLQDHKVGEFLKDHGYRYIHIGNWFAPTRQIRIADENPVLTSQTDFGALLDQTTLGPTINEMAGLKDPPAHHLLHRAAALFDFNELDRVEHEAGTQVRADAHPAAPRAVRVRGQRRVLGPE